MVTTPIPVNFENQWAAAWARLCDAIVAIGDCMAHVPIKRRSNARDYADVARAVYHAKRAAYYLDRAQGG